MKPNRYTDAPPLLADSWLVSLQIIFWLLVHPSAWQNAAARLGVASNFCLAELSLAQLRSPKLRSLFLRAFLALPFFIVMWVAVSKWAAGWGTHEILHSVIAILGYVASISLITGSIGSLGLGLAYAAAIGIGFGMLDPFSARNVYFPLDAAAGIAGSVIMNLSSLHLHQSLTRRVNTVLAIVGSLAVVVTSIVLLLNGIPNHSLLPGIEMAAGDHQNYGIAATFIVAFVFTWFELLVRNGRRSYRLVLPFVVGGVLAASLLGLVDSHLKDVWVSLVYGLGGGVFFSLVLCLVGIIAYRLGDSIAGGLAAALAAGLAWLPLGTAMMVDFHFDRRKLLVGMVCLALGFTQYWWRPVVMYPFLAIWNYLLYLLDQRRAGKGKPPLLAYHAAFWDEGQWLPWIGLEDHLLLAANAWPEEAQQAMQYLVHTGSRNLARAVQTELEARRLEACRDIEEMAGMGEHGPDTRLVGSEMTLLRQFEKIGHDLAAAIRQSNVTYLNQELEAALNSLELLEQEIILSASPEGRRFIPAANRWREILSERRLSLEDQGGQSEEIENPYVCGMPLNDQQEVFVGRTDLIERIEQALLAGHTPPLLLYGQRRMGKTSLMLNLGRILPGRLVPLFVDCQSLVGVNTYADFIYGLAGHMRRYAEEQRDIHLPTFTIEELDSNGAFLGFYRWLDRVEMLLKAQNRTALLMLDEFETLDVIFKKGNLSPEPFLNTLRSLIQHRPLFRVLLAGAHTLDEFQRWSSYLINLQVLKVGALEESEARQLIECPVRGFQLRFEEPAVQAVLSLTNRQPNLVQLVGYELVMYKNEQPLAQRRLATAADVEMVVPRVLEAGSFFFADIEKNQVQSCCVSMLCELARRGPGGVASAQEWEQRYPDNHLTCLRHLITRDLITPVEGGYGFSTELVRRWFASEDGNRSY
jgi:hypothetical protein